MQKSYKLVSLSDEKIIEKSYGEVKNAEDYSLKGSGNLVNRRDFIKARAITGGLYDPAIFGLTGYCKCQRVRVTDPKKIEICPTCGIPVAGSEEAQESIYGYYVAPFAYVTPVMLSNLTNKLKRDGLNVPVGGSAASPYDVIKSICMASYDSEGVHTNLDEDTDINTVGLTGLYNRDENYRTTLSKLIVVPSTVYRPCYPRRNKETGNIELSMMGDTKLGTRLSGVINFCEFYKERMPSKVSVIDYATYQFNFAWLMYIYHAQSPILQGGKYHSMRDLTRSTIESSIRATIAPLLDTDMNKIKVPKTLTYHALDEQIKESLMQDYGYTANEALKEILNNTELANKVFQDILKNKTVCCVWRNPVLYKNSVAFMYPEAWDEPSIGIPIELCLSGDTEIKLLDGSIVKIQDLVNNYEGKYVYSRDSEGNLVAGKIINACETGKSTELIELEFDTGIIRCTPEHRFMLSDGSYVAARDLTEDMEIASYKLSESMNSRVRGYECIEDENGNSDLTFHCIAGKTQKGEVIHHIDFNYKNNNPDNLVILNTKEHAKLHIIAYNKSDAHKGQFKYKDYTEYSKRMTDYNKSDSHRSIVSIRNSEMWKDKDYAESMQSYLNSPSAKLKKGLKNSIRYSIRNYDKGILIEDLWKFLSNKAKSNFKTEDNFIKLLKEYMATGDIKI